MPTTLYKGYIYIYLLGCKLLFIFVTLFNITYTIFILILHLASSCELLFIFAAFYLILFISYLSLFCF